MNTETLVNLLGQEWDQPDGFLGQLRMRIFDRKAYQRFLELLQSITFDDQECIDKRLVSLLWFISTFMIWQTESLQESGVDSSFYGSIKEIVLGELYRILEMP